MAVELASPRGELSRTEPTLHVVAEVDGAGAWIDRAAERPVRLGELRPAIGVLAALERAGDGTVADA
jgi:hypothetical protein